MQCISSKHTQLTTQSARDYSVDAMTSSKAAGACFFCACNCKQGGVSGHMLGQGGARTADKVTRPSSRRLESTEVVSLSVFVTSDTTFSSSCSLAGSTPPLPASSASCASGEEPTAEAADLCSKTVNGTHTVGACVYTHMSLSALSLATASNSVSISFGI